MSAPADRHPDDLLSLVQQGDGRDREKVFQQLRVRFVFLAKRRLGATDAEDVAHDACMTVLEKCRQLPAGTNFSAWALQVLRNKIGNRMQHQARVTEMSYEDSVMSGADPGSRELITRLPKCLKVLSRVNKRYIRALNLSQLGFSASEIAVKLEISKENLYVILNRGRQQLKKCLKEGTA